MLVDIRARAYRVVERMAEDFNGEIYLFPPTSNTTSSLPRMQSQKIRSLYSRISSFVSVFRVIIYLLQDRGRKGVDPRAGIGQVEVVEGGDEDGSAEEVGAKRGR